MRRKIVHIDEEKCNGCGACAEACHENAIIMIDGKARLIRDDYCDGLGDCLPACPADAIQIIEREASPYDDAAVKARQAELKRQAETAQHTGSASQAEALACGCPGSQSRTLRTADSNETNSQEVNKQTASCQTEPQSRLMQWPVQIKLAPINAPYFNGAKLLIAADCTAYAYANFHEKFIKGHITLVGCPKLDFVDYSEKLTEIFRNNDIQSVTVVRMEVPCCGGIEHAVKTALQTSGKWIPWQVVTISTDGKLLD